MTLSLSAFPALFCSAFISLVVCSPTKMSTEPEITLNLQELDKLGNRDEMLQKLSNLARALQNCAGGDRQELRLRYITNTSVTCNDGSQAGYYIRTSHKSTRWLVFLEGGWYCFDDNSCQGRWLNTPHLMSSEHWPDIKRGTGILSWKPDENPYLFNANIVYVPYCSSDAWSGTYKAKRKSEFSFMGSLIVQEVVKDLLKLGLSSANKMFLAGSSAGGVGVLVLLDRIADLVHQYAPSVEVRGIADSGWFLDNKQYRPTSCTDYHSCSPTEGIKRGQEYWEGQVPTKCAAHYSEDEKWRCYFGYRIYPTLKAPVFIAKHLFDEAQITADNVGPPVRKKQWQYIHKMGKDMRRTLLNVSAVFAPACLSHVLLTRSEWHQVSINGVTLPEAIKCWEDGTTEQNHYETKNSNNSRNRKQVPVLLTGVGQPGEQPLGDSPGSQKNSTRKNRRRHKIKRRRRRNRRRKGKKSKRQPKRSILFDAHDSHHMHFHNNRCKHHLIDHCAWPQCNLLCPKIRNPFTGEEMDFIDLLLQFGLDLSSIANALGIDLTTLKSMDHDDLLRLLTQQR